MPRAIRVMPPGPVPVPVPVPVPQLLCVMFCVLDEEWTQINEPDQVSLDFTWWIRTTWFWDRGPMWTHGGPQIQFFWFCWAQRSLDMKN
ncbi:hypothetical protein EYF80_067338 [Liparis tanakae]|uniref:Uncharacterized protein n=1 Tax=Liparis tanakae TaxID=230148 RepID=A0A4Z2E1G5_9TELE|nr:hypothetical protein EYF80_067338 [Liparis tanakae]